MGAEVALKVVATLAQLAASGSTILDIVDGLNALAQRMTSANRTDPTDEDLDALQAHVLARQQRINQA